MNLTALRLELRRSRQLLFWLAVVVAAYAGFITVFYTNVVQNAAEFENLVKAYPKALMAAFGIEGSLADPGVFLGGYVYSFIWPLVAAIGAIALASRIATDADRGFLDIALATPLSRLTYLAGSIVTQLVGLAVLALAMVGAVIVGDLLIEPDFPTASVALSTIHSIVFGYAIAGPATLLAVLVLDRGRAAGVAAGVLVAMYLLNVIGVLAPDLEPATVISIFNHFDLKPLIRDGTYPIGDTVLLSAIAIAGWALALVAFRRRDLSA
jgi:ABC-2 type transport system permease protein